MLVVRVQPKIDSPPRWWLVSLLLHTIMTLRELENRWMSFVVNDKILDFFWFQSSTYMLRHSHHKDCRVLVDQRRAH